MKNNKILKSMLKNMLILILSSMMTIGCIKVKGSKMKSKEIASQWIKNNINDEAQNKFDKFIENEKFEDNDIIVDIVETNMLDSEIYNHCFSNDVTSFQKLQIFFKKEYEKQKNKNNKNNKKNIEDISEEKENSTNIDCIQNKIKEYQIQQDEEVIYKKNRYFFEGYDKNQIYLRDKNGLIFQVKDVEDIITDDETFDIKLITKKILPKNKIKIDITSSMKDKNPKIKVKVKNEKNYQNQLNKKYETILEKEKGKISNNIYNTKKTKQYSIVYHNIGDIIYKEYYPEMCKTFTNNIIYKITEFVYNPIEKSINQFLIKFKSDKNLKKFQKSLIHRIKYMLDLDYIKSLTYYGKKEIFDAVIINFDLNYNDYKESPNILPIVKYKTKINDILESLIEFILDFDEYIFNQNNSYISIYIASLISYSLENTKTISSYKDEYFFVYQSRQENNEDQFKHIKFEIDPKNFNIKGFFIKDIEKTILKKLNIVPKKFEYNLGNSNNDTIYCYEKPKIKNQFNKGCCIQ